jgi:ribA/ribD-fused uncharacterized protein
MHTSPVFISAHTPGLFMGGTLTNACRLGVGATRLHFMDSTTPSADVLAFFSGSADKRPCKGAGGEAGDPSRYSELAYIRHWRRVLSNFHIAPFQYKNKTYNTIEHAFQAAKIELVDPDAAHVFSMESGSELSQSDGKAAQKQRKMRVLAQDKLEEWDKIKGSVMHDIAAAKFRASPEARRVLLATKGAQLWHNPPRGQRVRFEHLELIRDAMSTKPVVMCP